MKKILSYVLIYYSFLIFPTNAFALLGFDFDINSSVSTTYDDNVTFTKDNKISDVINSIVVGIGLKQEEKTYDLQINGNFIQQFFANNSSFNNIAQDATVDFQKRFTKYDTINITDTFLHAESPRSFEDEFGETTGRFSFYRNKFKSEYIREITNEKILKTWYGNKVYETSRAGLRDWLLHDAGIGMDFINSPTTTLSLLYGFTAKDLDPGAQATIHKLASGIKHFFKKTLSLEVEGGVLLIEDYNDKNLTKPIGKITLINNLSEKTKIALSYKKEHFPRGSREDIFDSWRITAKITQQLLERFAFVISGFYGEGDFMPSNISDKFQGIKSQITYDIRENAQAFLGYRYSNVDSSRDSRDYNKNLAEFGFTFTF